MANVSTLALAAIATPARGQTTDDLSDAKELLQAPLEELLSRSTTTASGGNVEERATAAGNVTVVGHDEITKNGWHSVAEVLENQPGLYVTGDGSLTSIGVRGITGGLRAGTRLLKIMINGTPVSFRPDLRAFIGPEYIPIDAVDRIEIVKGPLSALYGANAFLATVNIITREPPVGTQVQTAATGIAANGAHLGYGGSAVATYGGDHARLLVAATTYNVDRSGISIQRTFPAQNPTAPRYQPFFSSASLHDQSTPTGAFIQLSVPNERFGHLTIDAGYQHLDAEAEFGLNSTLTHQSRESIANGWVSLRHEKKWSERVDTQVNVAASTGAPQWDDRMTLTGNPAQVYTRNFGYRAVTASLMSTYSVGRISARFGLDAEAEDQNILYYTVTTQAAQGNTAAGQSTDILAPNVAKHQTLSDLGAHLQLAGQPVPDLQVSGNVRVDGVRYGGFNPPLQLSARAGAAYKWRPWFITKIVAGRAFQAPSGVLMFAEPGFGVSNNVIGNLAPASNVPPLKPQTSSTVEGVVYLLVGKFLDVELAGFYQQIGDEIQFVTAGTDYVARNSGTDDFAGFEASLQGRFDRFAPFATGAYVTNLGQPGATITAYPSLMGSFGLDVDVPEAKLHFIGRIRYVGERGATQPNVLSNLGQAYSLPAYASVDLTVSTADLPLLGDEAKTRFLVTVRNLLDERHSDPGFGGYDVPALGRMAFLELRQSF
jgi:outer membrane receptor protein involved in Fe transport